MLDPMVHGFIGNLLSQPAMAGFMLGFIMIGPDHLGTLMALSTLTSGISALKVGVMWGFGHSLGMVLIVPPFMLLRHVGTQTGHLTVDQWEYWGDYFIGGSLVMVAIYFYINESSYLERKSDGTYHAKSCSCHTFKGTEYGLDENSQSGQEDAACEPCVPEFPTKPLGSEVTPLLAQEREAGSNGGSRWSPDTRDWRSGMLGIFQGLCCPMGLMGMSFMGKMSGNSVPSLVLFIGIFMCASALGSGIITSGWGLLSSHGFGNCISPLVVYRVANGFTFALGVVWITANASGVLHYVNYLEGLHHLEHGAGAHESMPHEASHVSVK